MRLSSELYASSMQQIVDCQDRSNIYLNRYVASKNTIAMTLSKYTTVNGISSGSRERQVAGSVAHTISLSIKIQAFQSDNDKDIG